LASLVGRFVAVGDLAVHAAVMIKASGTIGGASENHTPSRVEHGLGGRFIFILWGSQSVRVGLTAYM
jgi:hypothetical protein